MCTLTLTSHDTNYINNDKLHFPQGILTAPPIICTQKTFLCPHTQAKVLLPGYLSMHSILAATLVAVSPRLSQHPYPPYRWNIQNSCFIPAYPPCLSHPPPTQYLSTFRLQRFLFCTIRCILKRSIKSACFTHL